MSSPTIKTPDEIEKMRVAGQLAASVLDMIEPHVQAGKTTEELDSICHHFIVEELRAVPAPLNYRGFPKSICTSVNNVVCHGIPGPRKLKNGDIINIDVTVIKDGFHGDTSRMYPVGNPSIRADRLCRITHESMMKGIETIRQGCTLGDLGHAVQKHAESHGFSVVREYCGHGIGKGFHEEPHVLHYGKPGLGMPLQAGMTITVEPMLNSGHRDTRLLADKWTVVTSDGTLSAQWEHTILVTETGFEILTISPQTGQP
ncbi:MAG: type I methionyl aminopeptidase [Acidiferrobacterales bacterium]|nr:type I methionyl aminopeptidase [Acidiferrobacterales bacterium]